MTLKCKICFSSCPRFAPELKASGYEHPKDLKCPICNTLHESHKGMKTEDWHKKKIKKAEKLR
jgi:hypothetical protein